MARRLSSFHIGLGCALILALITIGSFIWLRSIPPAVLQVDREQLVVSDGRLLLKTSGKPFSGIMVERYPSGNVKSRSGLLEGRLNGLSEGFYTNGQVQVRETFKAGVSDGPRAKYFDTGSRLSEATVQNGQIVGVFRRWYENGKVAEEIPMVNGVPEGPARAYYPSGFLKAEVTHSHGNVVTTRTWKDGEGALVASASVPTSNR